MEIHGRVVYKTASMMANSSTVLNLFCILRFKRCIYLNYLVTGETQMHKIEILSVQYRSIDTECKMCKTYSQTMCAM